MRHGIMSSRRTTLNPTLLMGGRMAGSQTSQSDYDAYGDQFGHGLSFNSGIATSYFFDDSVGTLPRVPRAIDPDETSRSPAMSAAFSRAESGQGGETTFLAISAPYADVSDVPRGGEPPPVEWRGQSVCVLGCPHPLKFCPRE